MAPPHAGARDRRSFVAQAAAGLSLGLLGLAWPTINATAQKAMPAGDAATQPVSTGGHELASATTHSVLANDDVEAVWFVGCLALIKGVGGQTGGALATVEFLHPPGFATVLHVHHTADEAFYVLAGQMRGVCGEREWQATTGGFVWLPRGVPDGYAVDGDEPLRTLAITLPAGFDRFVVEAGEPALERKLPPPAPLDIEKLNAAGAKYGIETLGPPVQVAGTPTA